MPNGEPIRGHVAKILNSRDLVINRGASDGVHVGMRFAVLDPNAENIKDPETGELLGSIDRTKIEVEVFSVDDRLSLAHTFKKVTKNVGGTGMAISGLSRALQPPKYVTRYETLKTDEKTWESISESESFVKTGDPVRQVVDLDYEEPAAITELIE
jgi:hypothetical protein